MNDETRISDEPIGDANGIPIYFGLENGVLLSPEGAILGFVIDEDTLERLLGPDEPFPVDQEREIPFGD